MTFARYGCVFSLELVRLKNKLLNKLKYGVFFGHGRSFFFHLYAVGVFILEGNEWEFVFKILYLSL